MSDDARHPYQPGDGRDTAVTVHRASPIANLHVATFSIVAHDEMPDSHGRPLAESDAILDADATKIVDTLIASLPGGTLDRIVGKLLLYKASHFIVNHDTHTPTWVPR